MPNRIDTARRRPVRLSTSCLVAAAALALLVAGCGEDGAVDGPKKIVNTNDAGASDSGVGDTGSSSGGDTGTASSSGTTSSSGGADVGGSSGTTSSSGGVDAGGTSGTTSSSGADAGGSSGGKDTAGGVVCVNDADCKALLTNLGPCEVGRCINNICQPGPAPDNTKCDDGTACTSDDGCIGGACKGGPFKCDDNNPCTEDSCDAGTAKCTNKVIGGRLITQCDDGDPCTKGDVCDGKDCKGKKDDCDDGNPCTDDKCTKASDKFEGGCVYTNNAKPCGDADKCFSAGSCSKGQCQAGKKLTCDDKNACTVDTCDAKTGKCQYTPGETVNCDDGNACTKGDTCQVSGGKATCKPGAAKNCDDGKVCTDDLCDPQSGTCSSKPNTAACDDGNACTTKDACKNAACLGGPAKVCDDGNACTDDVCDPKKGCQTSNNTAVCSDDKLCKLGTCKDGKCGVGDKAGCNDNNACTTDSCGKGADGKPTCVYTPVKAGPNSPASKCKDGSKCAKPSICNAGKCVGGALEDCSDGNPCTTDGCNPKTGCVWEANADKCDDGDVCTVGDDCASGKCKGLAKKDACNDANVCTKDSCDSAKGCKHEAIAGKCDDGNKCTKTEACKAGKCTGVLALCDDGKECTVDNCDPAKGACSWTGKTGGCNDGDECTVGDYCKAGKCVGKGKNGCDDNSPCTIDSCDEKLGKCKHVPADVVAKPIPCDDGDKCTKTDLCKAGKCVGSGGIVCDDGNQCTVDACKPATGKCGFSANINPCDNGNLCTWGDRCKNGKCVTGTNFSCDDGQACTTDSCDAKTGKCTYKPLANGANCSDGEACSTGDRCLDGKCTAKDRSKCAIFKDTFECKAAAKGWTLQNTKNNKVLWAVDQKPSVGNNQWGCNLNFNNNVNYCDKYTASNGKQYCRTPTGQAWSPWIDGTKLKGTPRLVFDTYYDVDQAGDNPRVELRSDNNQYLYGFNLAKSQAKKWRHMAINVPQVKGKKFRIRIYLSGASGQHGNVGKGWFVDNLIVDQIYAKEICNDHIDNDNNGQVDCLDVACKGSSSCKEVCDDFKDNDFDDKVDCADPDCKSSLTCTKPLFSADFNCGDKGWKYTDMKRNSVGFAIDGGGPKPVKGKCTLNFNNGKNFCGVADCKNGDANANAGMALYDGWIDATKYKSQLWLTYWSWIDAEHYGSGAYYDDRGFVQVSYDGFSGCCGATNKCTSSTLNQCNKSKTRTWIAPRRSHEQKNWRKVSINLYLFRGRKFQLRFRFNSGDGNNNTGQGWFVDGVRIYGK